MLDGPYVLATGLDGAQSVMPAPDPNPDGSRDLVVVGLHTTWRVDGDGKVAALGAGGVAGTSAPGRLVTDTEGIDVLGVEDGGLLRIDASGTIVWSDGASRATAPAPCSEPRSLALGDGHAWLVCADGLHAVEHANGEVRVAHRVALIDGRAAATDSRGRTFVVAGSPTALYRLDEGGALTPAARWVGDVTDAHFGVGGRFPKENVYLVTSEGALVYVRVPG